jgi:hypothetical protein
MTIFSDLYNHLDKYGRETGHTVVAKHLHKTHLWKSISGYLKTIPPHYPHIWTKLGIPLYVDSDTPMLRRYDMPIWKKIIDFFIRKMRLDFIYFYFVVRPKLIIENPSKYYAIVKGLVRKIH